MRRPPRPGEKILVHLQYQSDVAAASLFEAVVWCHAGPELIRFAFRNIVGTIVRPHRYSPPLYQRQRVRRSDEGITWRRIADADAIRAAAILTASARS